MEKLRRVIFASVGGAVLIALITFGYLYRTEQQVSADALTTKDNQLSTLTLKRDKLAAEVTASRSTIDQKEAELATKTQELLAKQAELEKASADLAAKVKALDEAQKKIKDQQSQISANSSELSKLRNRPPLFSFTVESSTLVNAEQKKQDVQAVVTAAYDEIAAIYGMPYLLHAVTISFVDSFSNPNAGAEIVISNGSNGLSMTIKLKDFDKNDFNDVNGVIHEIIHSFHGIALLDPVAYEEGITVAASDAVMAKLIAQGKIKNFSPLYIRISSSTYLGTSHTIPRSASAMYASPNVADYYQLAGYGWYQLYKADNNFFKTFNEKIYERKRNGEEITEQMVKETILASISGTVQGQSISSWLNTKAFALN